MEDNTIKFHGKNLANNLSSYTKSKYVALKNLECVMGSPLTLCISNLGSKNPTKNGYVKFSIEIELCLIFICMSFFFH